MKNVVKKEFPEHWQKPSKARIILGSLVMTAIWYGALRGAVWIGIYFGFSDRDDQLLFACLTIAALVIGSLLAWINTTLNGLDLKNLDSPLFDDKKFKLRVKALKQDIDRTAIFAFCFSVPAILAKVFPELLIKPNTQGALLSGPVYTAIEYALALTLILGVMLSAYLVVLKFRTSKAEYFYDRKDYHQRGVKAKENEAKQEKAEQEKQQALDNRTDAPHTTVLVASVVAVTLTVFRIGLLLFREHRDLSCKRTRVGLSGNNVIHARFSGTKE